MLRDVSAAWKSLRRGKGNGARSAAAKWERTDADSGASEKAEMEQRAGRKSLSAFFRKTSESEKRKKSEKSENTQSNRLDLTVADRRNARSEGAGKGAARRKKGETAVGEERREKREHKPPKPPRERKEIPAEKVPFSVTEFEVVGLNHARLLSLLAEEAHVFGARSSGRVFAFRVPSREKAKIVAILNTLCYDYKIKAERGVLLSALSALRRVGVVCGLLAVVAALVVFPNTVTSVECVGEWNSDVARILSDCGIVEGRVLFSFDGTEVARRLRELDGVVYASVDKVGTRVCVEVRAEHRTDSFAGVPGTSVKACKRAVVTRVTVFNGTAVVEYGDVVSEGDELIGGFVTVGDEKVLSAAAGEVYGMTFTEYARFFPDTVITAVKGEQKTYTRLAFGAKAPAAPEPPFADYVLETEVSRNGLLIGYRIYTFRYTEVTYVESANTLSEEEMKSAATSDTVTALPAGTTVLSATVSAERVDGGTLVKVTVAVEERIDSAIM